MHDGERCNGHLSGTVLPFTNLIRTVMSERLIAARQRPGALLVLLLALSLCAAGVRPAAAQSDSGYWQQEVHYTIEATLDEEAGHLDGAGTMVYLNRSPDALDEVFFHLHLNAFRPNSTWARVEQRENLNFQALGPEEMAYERLAYMRLGEVELQAEYPYAPDSTVVRFQLPEALAPGASARFEFAWTARPATLCRRQCREGRSYDFAHWYPRIAPYDQGGWQAHRLYPQGEFHGEYGVFDVTLELATDQVVGATGAVLEGDPGWRPSPWSPLDAPLMQQDWYAPRAPNSPGRFRAPPGEGYRRVRFYSENTHHFAWSASPEYLYEASRHGDVAVHVLYRPGDLDWDAGAAAGRTVRALEWLEGLFGPYPYPQLTNLHRLDGGGTEFPMVIMDGGPSQGLITHETAHQWAMGILGSNEWRESWLDEGMASFLTSWFTEEVTGQNPWPNTVGRVAQVEARGGAGAPIGTVSEDMPGFGAYSFLSYTKPSVVLYMLRELLGWEVMRDGLRRYADAKSFQHVTEADFRAAMEAASGQELGWFFQQWIHTTATLDWSVTEARARPRGDGWVTTVQLSRRGEAWMPVTVRVGDVEVEVRDRDTRVSLEVETGERPEIVELDPDVALLDVNRANNRVTVTGEG